MASTRLNDIYYWFSHFNDHIFVFKISISSFSHSSIIYSACICSLIFCPFKKSLIPCHLSSWECKNINLKISVRSIELILSGVNPCSACSFCWSSISLSIRYQYVFGTWWSGSFWVESFHLLFSVLFEFSAGFSARCCFVLFFPLTHSVLTPPWSVIFISTCLAESPFENRVSCWHFEDSTPQYIGDNAENCHLASCLAWMAVVYFQPPSGSSWFQEPSLVPDFHLIWSIFSSCHLAGDTNRLSNLRPQQACGFRLLKALPSISDLWEGRFVAEPGCVFFVFSFHMLMESITS